MLRLEWLRMAARQRRESVRDRKGDGSSPVGSARCDRKWLLHPGRERHAPEMFTFDLSVLLVSYLHRSTVSAVTEEEEEEEQEQEQQEQQ